MEESVVIRGKNFSRAEVEEIGRRSNRKKTNVLRWVGVGLLGLALILVLTLITQLGKEDSNPATIITGIIMLFIPGLVLFILSFVKRDNYKVGLIILEKKFPAPVGFDGNAVDILQGNKEIILSKRPTSSLIIDTNKHLLQIFTERKYSKIYTHNDVLDYELRVDNEIVVTSNTKTKKGVGKAVAGGILLGAEGAIAGSIAASQKSTTTTSQKEVHHYSLVIKVHDLVKASYVISIDNNQIAEEAIAVLDLVIGNKSAPKEELKTVEAKEEAPNIEKKKFCPECGAKLASDSKFCPECGHKL